MGTRADFYVGKGKNAEWIGSVAWDGYEWGERIANNDPDAITGAKTENEYREAVAVLLETREDGTKPDAGWPWPWDDSCTTDCAYCFTENGVEAFSWGYTWDSGKRQEWPNFAGTDGSAKAGSDCSGIILVK